MTKLKRTSAVLVAVFVCVLFFGCGKSGYVLTYNALTYGRGHRRVHGKSGYVLTYNALTWDAVAGEAGYKIYDGETLLADTADNAYIFRLAAGNHSIGLYSYMNGKDKKIAEFTYSVPELSEKTYASAEQFEAEQTSDESYFSAAQHLVIDYRGSDVVRDTFNKAINLAASVKKVSILADRRTTVNANFVIQKRQADIEFELENIILQGNADVENTIAYGEDASESEGSVIIKLFGSYNAIYCGYLPPSGANGQNSAMFQHGGTGGASGKRGDTVNGGLINNRTDGADGKDGAGAAAGEKTALRGSFGEERQ